jgi:hypothetical protein
MSKSKNWRSYPDTFTDLVNNASIQEISIPVEDEAQGKSLRGYIYGFFSALRAACLAPPKDMTQEERDLVGSLSRKASKIKLFLDAGEEGNWRIRAIPRDLDPLARKIATAIREQTDNPLETDHFQPPADLAALSNEVQKKKGNE